MMLSGLPDQMIKTFFVRKMICETSVNTCSSNAYEFSMPIEYSMSCTYSEIRGLTQHSLCKRTFVIFRIVYMYLVS